jgi:hypothetical protein
MESRSGMNSLEQRCADLKAQLRALGSEGRRTAVGSAEREVVLAQWGAVHAALSALQEELEEPNGREPQG